VLTDRYSQENRRNHFPPEVPLPQFTKTSLGA